jgi:tRNA modification GTPase
MEFIHRPLQTDETIAAVATPPGEGGVAIIRISGKDALKIAEKVFTGPVGEYKSHTVHFGKIVNAEGAVLDEVLIVPMLAPRSYTGEDTVEIQCHGGSLVTRKVLEAVLAAGARAANPGEFTFKAFINGKLDLAQAEAVQSVIHAKNELALHFAKQQLQGALSKEITFFQKELTEIAAILEAWVDFPEEGLEFASFEEVIDILKNLCSRMEKLSSSFHEGKKVHEGLSICLIGPPNAGKSSLMNALLGKDRAIVTPIAGTTRDLLEEDLILSSLNFRLVDTAGIRETTETIELEGIARSKRAMQEADLILLVLDASETFDHSQFFEEIKHKRAILVWNKADLITFPPQAKAEVPSALVSAKERKGLEELKEMIRHSIWQDGVPSKEEVLISSLRHKQALQEAIQALQALILGLEQKVSPEFLSSDMRKALNSLGTIIGTNITEDILSAIFSKFCVGK